MTENKEVEISIVFFVVLNKAEPAIRRLAIGIDSVLPLSFSSQFPPRPCNTPSIAVSSEFVARKNLSSKTAKHFKKRGFLRKTRRKATARLTPAVAF